MSEDDDSETVWIATCGASASTGSFHTRECLHCPDEANRTERDRELMEEWGYSQCTYCAEEHPMIDEHDRDDDKNMDQATPYRERIKDPDEEWLQELVGDD